MLPQQKKVILYILCLHRLFLLYLYIFNSHPNCHSFLILPSHNPVSSIPTFLNHTLIRPLFCTESFNVFSSHSGQNPSPYLMTCKTPCNVKLHLPVSSLTLSHIIFFFSQSPGSRFRSLSTVPPVYAAYYCLRVLETVVSSAKNNLSSKHFMNDSIDLFFFIFKF